MYGTTLRLPGHFPTSAPAQETGIPSYLVNLRDLFLTPRPTPHRQVIRRPCLLASNFGTSTYVFLRLDAIKPPLTAAYDVPFELLERKNKAIIVLVNEGVEVFSADRPKLSYVATDLDCPDSVGTSAVDTQPCITIPRIVHPSRPRKKVFFA